MLGKHVVILRTLFTHSDQKHFFFLYRFLSHSELAPLRVPLVPMEHCTSRFFQECDADKDKLVSFKEWITCFDIRNGERFIVSYICEKPSHK